MLKPGPKGPREGSKASLYRRLIAEGKPDDEIRAEVARVFPDSADLLSWYRWESVTKARKERRR